MPVTNEFIKAWRTWQHSASPYSPQSTREIEHDLSHMESYLYAIGLDAIAGKSLGYSEIAHRELSELNAVSLQLEASGIAAPGKEILRDHVALIRAVWLEIQKLDNPSGAIQQIVGPERR
jgi:hypothetical protein